MAKIKTKKEMNLAELIEWGWENLEQVRGKDFKSNVIDVFNHHSSLVQFSVDGYGFKTDGVSYKDTFTVEVEEEITEDTKLDLVERFIGGTGSVCYTSHSMPIKECLKRSPKECTTTHFYIENEDKELVLIWTKEKGLVE